LNFNRAFENALCSAPLRYIMLEQHLLRPVGNAITTGPACPSCGRSMHLARSAPRPEGLSDLRVYRCGECGVSLTQAADDSSASSRISA